MTTMTTFFHKEYNAFSVKGDTTVHCCQREITDVSDHVTYTEKLTLNVLPCTGSQRRRGVA